MGRVGRLPVIPFILLDTNALLFIMIDQGRLTSEASQAIHEAEKLIISSISIWEIAVKYKKGKLLLPFTPEELVYHLKSVTNLKIQPVDERIWLKNVSLDWNHKDPADRTIVATASLKGIPIVTSDEAIRGFYSKTIW